VRTILRRRSNERWLSERYYATKDLNFRAAWLGGGTLQKFILACNSIFHALIIAYSTYRSLRSTNRVNDQPIDIRYDRETRLTAGYDIKACRTSNESMRLLAGFEVAFPLERASSLAGVKLTRKILGLSEGTIGEISALLTCAALAAIERGTEQITTDLLDRCAYISPRERRRPPALV
jgi:hypothetical protein